MSTGKFPKTTFHSLLADPQNSTLVGNYLFRTLYKALKLCFFLFYRQLAANPLLVTSLIYVLHVDANAVYLLSTLEKQ